MTDPAAIKSPSGDNAAVISKQLAAVILKEDDTRVATTVEDKRRDLFSIPPTPASSLEKPSSLRASIHHRPLFGSVREALESSGQVKEEPGGYVIKRHSGRQQPPFRFGENGGKSKHSSNRHKQQFVSKDNSGSTYSNEDGADAAGYTVIRRRSSCDQKSLFGLATVSATQSPRSRNLRTSNASRVSKKQLQRSQRRSIPVQSQSSSTLTSVSPAHSSNVPPGFHPHSTSRVVIQPPSGLTPAASGWVAKAAAPAGHANKIEEPPVEALWPKVKSTTTSQSKTDSGWDVTTTIASDLQTWVAASNGSSNSASSIVADDDLLTRLGVTL